MFKKNGKEKKITRDPTVLQKPFEHYASNL